MEASEMDRLGWLIICGEIDGGVYDFDAMDWVPRKT